MIINNQNVINILLTFRLSTFFTPNREIAVAVVVDVVVDDDENDKTAISF
jgi:hypothetical protein